MRRWKMYRVRDSRFIAFALLVIVLAGCGRRKAPQQGEKLLARIGDRSISVNEFIRRAEYTLRPPYCRGDYPVHKMIVLNSLIAEKLFAIEAGDAPELTRTEEFQLYLQGRKEQAMRQWFFYKEAYEPIKLDTSEVKRAYSVAGRTYKMAYLSLPDSAAAAEVVRKARQAGGALAQVLVGDSLQLPVREVKWDSPEQPAVHKTIFSRKLQKNELLGPIRTEEGRYLVMQVQGWVDRPVITEKQIRQRWQDVSERLKADYADARYRRIVAGIMRGKRVEFAPETFRKLVNLVAPVYIKTYEEKKAAFNRGFWGAGEGMQELQNLGDRIEAIRDQPVLRIDGEIWTVRELERQMAVHPLVFRKRRIKAGDFAEQFKLAIVDMIQDRYVAQEAYRRGYDRVPEVQRYVQMWRDNLLYLYHLNQYLRRTGKLDAYRKNYMDVLESDLNAVVDSLVHKYSDEIEIDTKAFNAIQLTRVPMLAMQRNVPFPVLVPSFPIVTTRHRLDYGRKMEAN